MNLRLSILSVNQREKENLFFSTISNSR